MWRHRKLERLGTVLLQLFMASCIIARLNTMCSWFRPLLRITPKWDAECLSKSISLTLFLTNSRRTWELTQRSKVNTFIKIYWTLNIVTKDSIWKTWWGTTFGGFFGKALCSTLANLEELLILNLFFSDFWLSLSTYHASVVFYLTAWTKM